jgi:chemotaxis protein methyltransferase CheR
MIAHDEYAYLQAFLRERVGNELADGRDDLVLNRLGPLAATLGLDSVSALLARLRADHDRTLQDAIVDAMANNETYFFRAPRVFESLRRVIVPALKSARAGTRRLRIWSAACSTGQEPYSIAMTLADQFPNLADWWIDILATDVSERALEHARRGSYSQFEVQRGLPIQSLLKHFQMVDERWQISHASRRPIQFRKHNLLDPLAELGGPFDLILVRNVLIYFDNAAKTTIFARLRDAIAADGYLILGESETILGLTDQFRRPDGDADYYVPAVR